MKVPLIEPRIGLDTDGENYLFIVSLGIQIACGNNHLQIQRQFQYKYILSRAQLSPLFLSYLLHMPST
jgi:hypothetical protein